MAATLNEDLLTEIFRFVHDVDRPTIFSLNLVNSAFHSMALPFVYRECSFDISAKVKPEDIKRIQKWLDAAGKLSWIPSTIRQITLFTKPYSYPRLDQGVWNPFVELIQRTTNLSIFIFSVRTARLPAVLHRALERYPTLSLVVEHWNLGSYNIDEAGKFSDGYSGGNFDEDIEMLAQSSLLRELAVVNNDGPHDVTFIALRHLISLAPNVQKLAVCFDDEEREDYWCGNVWEGHEETLAQAEEWFKLPGNGKHQPLHHFTELALTPSPPEFEEHCLTIVDPAHLERLELKLPVNSNANVLVPLRFTALRHLALETYEEQLHNVLDPFFRIQCMGTSLASLTLRTVYPISGDLLLDLLDAHGPTLKKLILRNDLHQSSSYAAPGRMFPSSSIHVDSISLIRDKCSTLEHLSLCVSRINEVDLFETLGTFSHTLQHLELDFGSGFSFVQVSVHPCYQARPDFDALLKPPYADIEERERMLWLHMPMAISVPQEIFGKIYKDGKGASSLETLVVKIRHPWANERQQKFQVRRRVGGLGLTTTVFGYEIPMGEKEAVSIDNQAPLLKRLETMWTKMCPREPFPPMPPFESREESDLKSNGSND